MEFLNKIANNWPTIVMTLAASGLLPAIAMANEAIIKKIIGLFTDVEKKFTPLERQFIVYAWGSILALVHYIIYIKTGNPWIAAIQGAFLFVTSQPFYIKFWKPVRTAIGIRIQETKQQKLDATAAIVAPEGIPLQPATEEPFQG